MNTLDAALRLPNSASADPVHLSPLSLSHIGRMIRLQNIVLAALAEDEKSFIVPQTRRQYKMALKAPHYSLGIFSPSGKLVGQALLAVCTESRAEGYLTESPAARLIATTHRKFGVIHGVLVDPAYRRHGLMHSMLEIHEMTARSLGLKALVGEIAESNWRSEKGFTGRGFGLAGNAVDPADDTPLKFLHKPLRPEAYHYRRS